jgi:apolipoprotein N-acyltransferase
VLVLPTNASSYVTDDVPAQELAAARLRAWETGRDLGMVAPTGYSAMVAADGAVLDRSELGAAALVRAALTPRSGLTPHTQAAASRSPRSRWRSTTAAGSIRSHR